MDSETENKSYLDEIDIFKLYSESKYSFSTYKFNFKKRMLYRLNESYINNNQKNKLNKKTKINTNLNYQYNIEPTSNDVDEDKSLI